MPIDVSEITSGTIDQTRLGGGTASSGTFLRGDQAWAVVPAAPTSMSYVLQQIDSSLTNARELAGESGVVTIDDAGAGNSLTIGIASGGIRNAKLCDSAATSIIGRAADTSSSLADIAASADDQVLRRAGGTLAFGQVGLAVIDTTGWTKVIFWFSTAPASFACPSARMARSSPPTATLQLGSPGHKTCCRRLPRQPRLQATGADAVGSD